jgi:hypothetical protein
MILAPSESLIIARSLGRWEAAEYVCAALVTLGCVGEFIAEFTHWFTGEVKERKERLAKYSTLLLIFALAAELVCLVKTNQLSGMMIAALNQEAGAARRAASESDERAATAEEQAAAANRTAESFRLDIAKANESAAEANRIAEAERLARLKIEERFAPRTLTEAQVNAIAAAMSPFSGQEFWVQTFWDLDEPLTLTKRIAGVLSLARWRFVKQESRPMMLGGFAGISVSVQAEADERTNAAAASLVSALNKVGIASKLVVYSGPKTPNQIRIAVGTKN